MEWSFKLRIPIFHPPTQLLDLIFNLTLEVSPLSHKIHCFEAPPQCHCSVTNYTVSAQSHSVPTQSSIALFPAHSHSLTTRLPNTCTLFPLSHSLITQFPITLFPLTATVSPLSDQLHCFHSQPQCQRSVTNYSDSARSHNFTTQSPITLFPLTATVSSLIH